MLEAAKKAVSEKIEEMRQGDPSMYVNFYRVAQRRLKRVGSFNALARFVAEFDEASENGWTDGQMTGAERAELYRWSM